MLVRILILLLSISQILNGALFRRVEEFDTAVPVYACRTNGYASEDTRLIQRIIASYQLAKKEHLGNSMWQMFFEERHKKIHDAFINGNFKLCASILREPRKSDLFYGFDNLCVSILPDIIGPESLVISATSCLDSLVRLGEAISAIKIDNPEVYIFPSSIRKWYASEVLMKIEDKLGMQIYFPNPYRDEIGIWTEHGTISHHATWALYQAYIISEHLKGIENPKVLEVGAGLGRTAYYARMFGISNYTIVDIPITNLSQAYFLGKVLGENEIALLGEKQGENKIKILTPDQFLNGDRQYYDLIINVDSLTEMDQTTMQAYIEKISHSTPLFISINHEWNKHTVNEYVTQCYNLNSVDRKPYWMRTGYIEEVFKFSN